MGFCYNPGTAGGTVTGQVLLVLLVQGRCCWYYWYSHTGQVLLVLLVPGRCFWYYWYRADAAGGTGTWKVL